MDCREWLFDMLKSFVILAAGLILMAGTIEYAPTRTLESGMAYVWDFIHASHEEIIAIATIFIAIYTIILGTATSALVKEAKITTKHQLRAYIGVKAVSIHTPNVSNKNYKVPDPIPAEGYVWSDLIKIIVKNFGSTPASNIAVYLNWQPTNFGGRLMKDFAYGDMAISVMTKERCDTLLTAAENTS